MMSTDCMSAWHLRLHSLFVHWVLCDVVGDVVLCAIWIRIIIRSMCLDFNFDMSGFVAAMRSLASSVAEFELLCSSV